MTSLFVPPERLPSYVLPAFQYLTLYHVSEETRWHHHPHPELGYVMTGSFVLNVRGKGATRLEFPRDTAFLIPPGLRHQERLVKPAGAEVIYLGAVMADAGTGGDVLSAKMDSANPLKSLLISLLEANERMKGDGTDGARRYRNLSTALILETFHLHLRPHVPPVVLSASQSLLHRARNLIGSHYQEKRFGPAALARGLGISLRSLQIQFRTHRGRTPVEAILQTRMDRARELLAFTRESIPVVASLCGFSSPGYFMRTFGKYVGMTASQYRKQHALREGAPSGNFYPPTAESLKRAGE